ncbi:MAG TPA: hypothetical protein VMI33_16160 [Streptosporangiaceae bacterium]|nr:hypothetical protein [Streptosporangiaceae bacterium]
MRRVIQIAAFGLAATAACFLAAGCGSGVSSAIKSLAPSASISVPALPTGASPTAQPTVVPTTAPPTVAPTTTAAPTSAAQPTASPAASTASSLLWLWILIGVVVVIGIIVLIVVARRSGGKGSVVVGGWLSRAVDAYAQGSALYDAMSVAQQPGALAAADSGTRWADIQRRADDFTQRLYALRESAVDDDDRARVDDVLGTLQAVRSGMDAQRAPGGAGPEQAEVVRGRLAAFGQALAELRPSDGRAY